ncbi:hypothetical protein BMETH_1884_0 [methanotrophic bacterial endosymbiont of Bathymodiolus sp.]|nr:hypothetical protein BMETH_1884_0 [methanotrophic bacterial endosymbiont of Bathymodiolus sp.]
MPAYGCFKTFNGSFTARQFLIYRIKFELIHAITSPCL